MADQSMVALEHNNLGSAWHALGKYEKVLEYFDQSLSSNLKTYGEDQPNTKTIKNR